MSLMGGEADQTPGYNIFVVYDGKVLALDRYPGKGHGFIAEYSKCRAAVSV